MYGCESAGDDDCWAYEEDNRRKVGARRTSSGSICFRCFCFRSIHHRTMEGVAFENQNLRDLPFYPILCLSLIHRLVLLLVNASTKVLSMATVPAQAHIYPLFVRLPSVILRTHCHSFNGSRSWRTRNNTRPFKHEKLCALREKVT